MENNLSYFQPQISDIHIGYECEIKMSYNKEWIKIKADVIYTKLLLESFYDVRTPYLTKEQIEAEGWKISNYSMLYTDFNEKDFSKDYYAYLFEKENYTLVYNTGSKVLSIIVKDPSLVENSDFTKMSVFRGECKSINEFRYVCKLLKIVNE